MRGIRRRTAKSCSGSSSASTSCPTARCACSSRNARDQSKASFHASSRIACGTSSGSNGRSAASAAATLRGTPDRNSASRASTASCTAAPPRPRPARRRVPGLAGGGPSRVPRSFGSRPVDGTQDRGERGRILNLGFVHRHRPAHQPVSQDGYVGRVHAAGDPHADRGEPERHQQNRSHRLPRTQATAADRECRRRTHPPCGRSPRR